MASNLASPGPKPSKAKWILLGVTAALTVCCCLPVGLGGGFFWYGANRTWPEFTSAEGRFSVRMFGTPTYLKLGRGTHQYIHSSALGVFNASYLDDLPSEEEAALRFAVIIGKPEMVVLADYPGCTLVAQKSVQLGTFPGQEFTLDTAEKIRVMKRLYLVKKRVYVLTAVKASDTSRAKFFDSFKVIEP